MVDQALELGVKECIDVVLLGREVVGEGDTLLARSTTRQKGVLKKTETARGCTLTVQDPQYPTERRSES